MIHRTKLLEASSVNSFLLKTNLSISWQGWHQSEPVNFTRTDLLDASAALMASSIDVNQSSAARALVWIETANRKMTRNGKLMSCMLKR